VTPTMWLDAARRPRRRARVGCSFTAECEAGANAREGTSPAGCGYLGVVQGTSRSPSRSPPCSPRPSRSLCCSRASASRLLEVSPVRCLLAACRRGEATWGRGAQRGMPTSSWKTSPRGARTALGLQRNGRIRRHGSQGFFSAAEARLDRLAVPAPGGRRAGGHAGFRSEKLRGEADQRRRKHLVDCLGRGHVLMMA
jgi:hypothetical protein